MAKVGRPKSIPTHEQYIKNFTKHYYIDETNDCYLWQSAKNNIGYGMFRYDGKMQTSHRVAMQFEGHDVKGKFVFHTCDNYNCVNPKHLRVGSLNDKAKMMTDKGHSGRTFLNPIYFKKCSHCGTNTNPAIFGHFHGDKCKHKP